MITILSALVSLLSFRVRSRAHLELHITVFGEAHLRRILGAYAAYYLL